MTVTMKSANGFAGAREAFRARTDAAATPWLTQIRQDAWERFVERGLPTLSDEDWRFTDVSRIADTPFSLAEEPGTTARPSIGAFEDVAGPRLTFLDGHFHAASSSIGELPDGVVVSPLSAALVAHGDLVREHVARLNDAEAFTALNGAFLEDGLFVHVPDGVELPGVVQARFLTGAATGSVMSHPRSLVILGDGAKATVMEELLSEAEDGPVAFTNGVTQIVVGARAEGRHYLIECENEQACVVSSLYVDQQEESDFASHSVLIGGSLVRNNVFPSLKGTDCLSVVNGVYVPHRGQLHDNRMLVRHSSPDCRSRQYYRGILGGRARSMFSGRIIVDEGAQKTDAVQSNKNLLLSRHAIAQTKPQLEIYADDVKCTHGATTGQIDESALFYFQARGIPREEGRRLLTFAFVNEIFERMECEPVREKLRELVSERLVRDESEPEA